MLTRNYHAFARLLQDPTIEKEKKNIEGERAEEVEGNEKFNSI